jgi:8-amino-7-oxononanoate synthase
MKEEFLDRKLEERQSQNAFRRLRLPDGNTDFSSNDYLGMATNGLIETLPANTKAPISGDRSVVPVDPASSLAGRPPRHGSGGSRLLSGNYSLIEETERYIAAFHEAGAGLIFNSGYDANLGLLSCVPQRGDTIIYDQLSHASIRDGIRLSFAQAHSFRHNDLEDLEQHLQTARSGQPAPASSDSGEIRRSTIFVVTESVFSMDGDQAPLCEISSLCEHYEAQLIVDEAHATGVIGKKGEGLVQVTGLPGKCFARVHTFGKAVGCHGAIVLGSGALRDYLINFSRSFIYTTALPETSTLAIRQAYELFPHMAKERLALNQLIDRFRRASLAYERLDSLTPIQVVVVPGNEEVKRLAQRLQDNHLDIRPILYPTVPKGAERLRIVLHSFNTTQELEQLIAALK